MFQNIPNKVSFPKLEEEIISFWKSNKSFETSVALRKKAAPYIFYDGPPFATGLPHHGHLLAGTIKDIIPRYQTMRGHYVERRFGWDCHGLPVEMEIQNSLKLSKHKDIENYGVEQFNKQCESIVLRYTSQWRDTVERLGRWIDFDNDYKTMDLPFMESVWWVFKTLFDKGLIYEGYKVVPYSFAAGSILSNFEANLAYQETDDPSIVVRFPIEGSSNLFFLAWTTTPWTLTANLALCLNPENIYVKVLNKQDEKMYWLGENAAKKYFESDTIKVVERKKGKELTHLRYKGVFDYAQKSLPIEKIYRVIADDYVSDEEGTGVVQMAPVFGEDDFRVATLFHIPSYDPVDEDGNFLSDLPLVGGQNIKDADKVIIRDLKQRDLLFHATTIRHSYPFCWRTDKPLIYKAFSSWFVNVEKIKENLIESNEEIHWIPNHIKNGRFGKWLENARDWAISRNRFWGTPIPIWKADDNSVLCIGDIATLEKLSGKKVTDLHKHHIDKLVLEKDGKKYHRVSEVLDCWFESGSMPYAQPHYPFEGKEEFSKRFPADFIAEGLDQTRGWFYTLLVIGCGLFGKSPYRNVIVNGLILAEDGKKMSKRLKNYPEPKEVFDNYGADALRLYLVSSPVIRGETLRFSKRGLENIVKSILIPLWNAFSFFTTYANIDNWTPEKNQPPKEKLDRWIISVFQSLVKNVETAMETYELHKAVPPILSFIDVLTNIYIRRSRRRFWKSEDDADKMAAYSVLYTILSDLSKVIAPFTPFVSEKIYQVLRKKSDPSSIHHCDFPHHKKENIDEKLEAEIEMANTIIFLGRVARTQKKIKIRQPLNKLIVISQKERVEDCILANEAMICEELNVKKVVLEKNQQQYVDTTAKANFKILGKKIGQAVKEVNQLLSKKSPQELMQFEQTGSMKLTLKDGKEVSLSKEDVELRTTEKDGQDLAKSNNIACLIDANIDEKLLLEGIAREFIHGIQQERKEQDLHYTEKIDVAYQSQAIVEKAIEEHSDHISKETLCMKLEKIQNDNNPAKKMDINGHLCKFYLTRKKGK